MKSSPNVRQSQVSNCIQTFSTKDANSGLPSSLPAAKTLLHYTTALLVPQGFPAGQLIILGVTILKKI